MPWGCPCSSLPLSMPTGSAFWCLLDMMPIKNEMGEVVLFLFSFKDITQSGSPGLGPQGGRRDSNHENSLGRRGATWKFRSARRRSRTVLHRLTGHFGRRGQGGMKANNVSPTPNPTSPKSSSLDSEAPLPLSPCFPVCLVSLLGLLLCPPISHTLLSAPSYILPSHPSILHSLTPLGD